MTKEKFLEMLEKCTLDTSIKENYLPKFKDLLEGVDPKRDLDIDTLLKYPRGNAVEYYIRDYNRYDNQEIIEKLYNEVQNWTLKYMTYALKSFQSKANDDKTRHHKKHIISIVFIILLILFSLVAATFSLLDIINNTGGKIAAVCGVLDFIFGVLFFIAELIDDMQKKNTDIEFEEKLTRKTSKNGDIHIGGSVGNGNTISTGDVTNDEKSTKKDDEQLSSRGSRNGNIHIGGSVGDGNIISTGNIKKK